MIYMETLRNLRTCFNSATTWRPWRTGWRRSAARDARAQFGHDLEAVENPTISGLAYYSLWGFNSATTWRPWRTSSPPTYAQSTESFNSATTWRPWRTTSGQASVHRTRGLQFGHDLEAVEYAKLTLQSAAPPIASIRPRPGGRGERGPDRRRRQTGQGFNSATTWRPWRTNELLTQVVDPVMASIRPRPGGRGEPSTKLRYVRLCSCFNSATTWRPWRTTAAEKATELEGVWLQFGHDLEAVENLVEIAAAMGATPLASIRPRPGRRGERGGRRASESFTTRLQFGHDLEAVENASEAAAGARPAGLQFGHDLEAVENCAIVSAA